MKVTIFGDKDVGITTFMEKYASSTIHSTSVDADGNSEYSTKHGILKAESIGTMYGNKDGFFQGREIRFQIQSLISQKREKVDLNDALSLGLVGGTTGLIFFYDLTNPKTFSDLSTWLKLALPRINKKRITSIIIVGNKIDLIDEKNEIDLLNQEDKNMFIKEIKTKLKIKAHSVTISVLENINVDDLFEQLAEDLFTYLEKI